MSSHASLPRPDSAEAIPLAQVQALRRVALAVAHPGGPDLFADLVRELAASLQVGLVFMAVFADDSRSVMRTLAACLDGRMLRNFDYALEGSPCAAVVGRSCQFVRVRACCRSLTPGSLSARERMDSFAAFPLNDSAGEPLGLVVAMDRQPIAGGDADHAEAMLKIIAGRVAAEIERERTDEALRAVALAVSASRSGTVFDELVRLLATILHVEVAFIARYEPAQPQIAAHAGDVLRRADPAGHQLSAGRHALRNGARAALPGLSRPTCRRCSRTIRTPARSAPRATPAIRWWRWTARRWASCRWPRGAR